MDAKSILRILTFDLEEWFHILDFEQMADPTTWNAYSSRVDEPIKRILDLLDIYGLKATYFVPGWLTERRADLVRKAIEYEMTYSHPSDVDPGKPIFEGLPVIRCFKNRVNLKGALIKLSKYLKNTSWLTVNQAQSILSSSQLPRIGLETLR